MVDEAAEVASECVSVYASGDACSNDASGQKVMVGEAAEVVNVAIMLLVQLTLQPLPL
jgi:acyl-coenzyme A synthetase/AMP-(fatty) acid ligase